MSSQIQQVPRTAISAEVLKRNSIEINHKNWQESQSTDTGSPIRTRVLRWLLACWAVTTKNCLCRKNKSSSKDSSSGVDSVESKKLPVHANLCKSFSEGNTSPSFANSHLFQVLPKISSASSAGKTFDELKLSEVTKVPIINVEESESPDIPLCIQPENTFLTPPPGLPPNSYLVLPPSLPPAQSTAHAEPLAEHAATPSNAPTLTTQPSNLPSNLPPSLPTALPQIIPTNIPPFLNPVLPQLLPPTLNPNTCHPGRSFEKTTYMKNPKSVSRDNSRYTKNETEVVRKSKLLRRSASLQGRKVNDDFVTGAKAKAISRKLSDLAQAIDIAT